MKTFAHEAKNAVLILLGIFSAAFGLKGFPLSSRFIEAITGRLNRGVTVLKGKGGIGSTGASEPEQSILYCVVTRLEIGTIKR
jgi:uncharacterized membrane-anchored protein YitT (DUF2179 family)